MSVSKLFPKNTILVTIAANIGDTAITQFDVACPDSLVAIQTYHEEADVIWLKLALDMKKMFLNSEATQNAQKNINLQNLKPLVLKVPSLREQQRIAACLSSLDELITAQSEKIQALKSHKKGLMQQLFPAVDEVGA